MEPKVLGILGGMGPLASLAFLRTIYECNRNGAVEQAYPNVLLHSLSAVPDRTAALLNREEKGLEEALARNLTALAAAGATRIVICCFTSHSLLDRLPREAAAKVVSLVDLTARELLAQKRPALLLASPGSYQKQVFASTAAAREAKDYIVEPEERDKEIIRKLIYDELKVGRPVEPVQETVRALLTRYGLDTFIAGCTEFHILTRHLENGAASGITFIDPLFTIARELEMLLAPGDRENTPASTPFPPMPL